MTFELPDANGEMRGQQIIVPIQANEEYVPSSARGASGRNIESDIDESEEDLGRRPGYILRRRLERERRQ